MPHNKFWKDRILSLVDEIVAATLIAAGTGIVIALWRMFTNRFTDLTLLQNASVVILCLLTIIFFGIEVWRRRGRWAVDVKGRILDERLQEKGKYFVGREELVTKFRKAINPKEQTDRLFALYGVGGIGKSALLEEFRRICYEENVPFAYCEGSIIHNEIDVFQTIHEQLAAYNVPFGSFQKGMERYYRLQAKVGEHPDISPKVIQMLSKGLVVATSVAPGGKQVTDAIGAENIEVAMSAIYRLLKPEEARFFLNPEQELTDMLVHDLNDYLANGPLAIFFDTYEQMESLDEWLRLRFVERLSKQAVVVFAGRNPLPRDWGYTAIIRQELRELPTDASVTYLRNKGIDNDKLIGDIVSFTGGLPLALTLINEMLRAHPDLTFDDLPKEKEMLPALVEQMLRTAPDDIRDVLEVCAALRWFNVDILAYMLDVDEVEAKAIFGRLQKLEFVIQKGKKGLALHDRLREFLDQTAKFVDEKGYVARHEKAMGYFEKNTLIRIEKLEDADIYCDWLYHFIKLNKNEALRKLIVLKHSLFYARKKSVLKALFEKSIEILELSPTEKEHWKKFNEVEISRIENRWQDGILKAEELLSKKTSELLRGFVYLTAGGLYRLANNINNNVATAKKYCLEAISIFEDIAFNEALNFGYLLKAAIFLMERKPKDALESYQKANASFRANEDYLNWVRSAIYIADTHIELENYTEALEICNNAEDEAEKRGFWEYEINALNVKAKIYNRLQDIESNSQTLEEVLNKSEKYELKHWACDALYKLGHLNIDLGTLSEALSHYANSLFTALHVNYQTLMRILARIIKKGKQTNHPEILSQLLTYWQDPANTLDSLTLIEAEQRNRERENATGLTVVEQLQAALKEFETNQTEDKGDKA